MRIRLSMTRPRWRCCAYAVLIGGASIAIAVAAFLFIASRAQPNFKPVAQPLAPEIASRIDRLPHYRRAEDATYLTFVEWYLVFNPQEYAQFIAANRPSRFPYFRGIGQIWSSYTEVYGIARQHYPFNVGYHLMLVVIGVSSTAEFAIKGVYETTIGRVFEWTASGEATPEDIYAANVAHNYGAFITTQPWFEFPFGEKLRGLWSEPTFFGTHFLRKCERKFFLSLEYGVKALYAATIRFASRSVYGVADTEVYLSAHNVGAATLSQPGVRGVEELDERYWILAVPHYQGFTDAIPLIARDGVDFDEIAGNDEIMLTLIAPAAWTYDLSGGRPLFTMPLLVNVSFKRVAVQVPVKSLGSVLREIGAKDLKLEHLFDY